MAQRLSDRLRFGRYEALLRLGAGGMAEVFAARLSGEAGFHKLVAVKRMLPHLSGDEDLVDRFFDEARIAAQIVSPHVVRTLDVGRSADAAPFIVLELVIGVTLTELLRRQRKGAPELPLAVVVELLAQVADGLADAHAATMPDGRSLGIIHRDVSPQNVLIGADGRARLTDFGIAQALVRRAHTATGRIFGKLGYMAPEQATGQPATQKVDIFALGIVAWESIARRHLFGGSDQRKVVDDLLRMPIPRLDALRDDVPRVLADVVASALERDEKARCASAAELTRGLREAARALGESPDAAVIAAYVADTGGDALAEVHRRIALASRPESERDEPRTATAMTVDPDEDVEATIVADALEGTVNVSGEETWSSAGERPAPRVLEGAPTQLLPPELAAAPTVVSGEPRSALARAAVPLALLLLAAGIGLGAYLGSREEVVPPATPSMAPVPPVVTEEPAATMEPAVEAPEAEPPVAEDASEAIEPAAQRPRRRRPREGPTSAPPPEEEHETVRPGMLLGVDRFPEGR